MSEMKIKVRFKDGEILAETEINLDRKAKNFSFILNKNLTLTEVLCGGKPAEIRIDSEIQPLYRSVSNQITLQGGEQFSAVKMKYGGKINGWLNLITEEIISLNWYSVWFPQELSENAGLDLAEIFGCGDYILIKGEYDSEGNIRRYGGQGFDPFNLILYKKSSVKTAESKHTTVFYIDDSMKKSAEISKNIYEDILKYYTEDLFKQDFSQHIDIACFYPQIKSGGAYKRRGLICCAELGSDENAMIPLNAHELAHEWCGGADVLTWEDWLNETTAEWSMLLYALERGRTDIFSRQIEAHKAAYSSFPAVKTADGSRPDGVHTKGTVIFYELYKRLGAETIKRIIFLFANLETKTTEKLLAAMRRAELSEAADFLEKQITQP